MFEVHDDKSEINNCDLDSEEGYRFPFVLIDDGVIRNAFESEGPSGDMPMNLVQVYEQLEKHESELSRPPPSFILKETFSTLYPRNFL